MAMNLCHCNGLTEAEIAEAIRAGARAADSVFAHWRCGQLCGACRFAIIEMLAADARRRARRKSQGARPARRR